MKSNENQFKCYSTNLRDFLEDNGFKSWDRAYDWNSKRPFWYFEYDLYGRLAKYLTIWSNRRQINHY